ncbi:MAG: acyl-CoA dehydrogenase family protein [Bacteroidales bacterium]
MESPYLSEKHKQLINRVREFAREEIQPLARELDEKEEFSSGLTKKIGEQGLFGMFLPEKYGGKGTDYLSLVLAVEEIARVDSSQAATVAAHNSLGIGPVYMFGTEKQKENFLPDLTTGNKLWAFGLTEDTAGSDARGTETKAELTDGNWVINGSKRFISNAASELASGITLQAITGMNNGEKELSVILVRRDTPGYEARKYTGKMMWRAADTGILRFTNMIVPGENLLGEKGKGAQIMLKTLDSGRLTIGAIGLGLAEGAYEIAVKWSKKRVQFGRSISNFQAVSFKLADMAMKIEAGRNLLYHACWLKDNGHHFAKEAAMAKLYTSEIAREIADEALQVHGAYGLMKENDIERFYRDQRLLQIGEGTSEILRLVISRYILDKL